MPYKSARGAPKGQPLSFEEIAALRDVANRKAVKPTSSRCLKKLGLIEQRLGDWSLTQQGCIQLMFCNAH
jgi:hypothetical protein